MKCFVCGTGTLRVQPAAVDANVRGESFRVEVVAEVCDHCGEVVMDDAQADAYSIASADAYRRAHGLLTTHELKAARKRLGLSQRAFAARLGVGVNSVKRWEGGAIQDESSDRLIRLCTDVEAARTNLRELESALSI
jgi:putative zinc finger/helix-turn-helix YgiT family protein